MDAFWNLGFVQVKPLNVLLDKDDLKLTEVLDDPNLFSEVKEKNEKIIAYFCDLQILKQLFTFVTADVEEPGFNKAKYQHIATEILCANLDDFVETCLRNQDELLQPFWSRVLWCPIEDRNAVTVSQFCKVFVAFLNRRPVEIVQFVQHQEDGVGDLLNHIEMPQIADIILKILNLDKDFPDKSMIDWLYDQGFIRRLIERLSPSYPEDMHHSALELVKNIVLKSSFTPAPGRKEPSELSSNRLARDLVSPRNSAFLSKNLFREHEQDPFSDEVPTPPTPSAVQSSFLCTASLVTELIRKNNLDLFEAQLLRISLESINGKSQPEREEIIQSITHKVGMIDLSTLVKAICDRLSLFQGWLEKPHSTTEPLATTIGPVKPLTLERLRICELYGELLSYSNMGYSNRLPGASPSYDEEGRLIGGADGILALNTIYQMVHMNTSEERGDSQSESSSDDDDDSDDSDSEQERSESPNPVSSLGDTSKAVIPATSTKVSSSQMESEKPNNPIISDNTLNTDSSAVHIDDKVSPGDQVKQRFLDLGVLGTLMDLIFEYPWNNFLHTIVYDIFHQILFGKVEEGCKNRELIISLFRDVKVQERIVDGMKRNEMLPLKSPRLGYTGHLINLTSDIITALKSYPSDLNALLQTKNEVDGSDNPVDRLFSEASWEQYITGSYESIIVKQQTVFGGPKPTGTRPVGWGAGYEDDEKAKPATTQEFKRSSDSSVVKKQTADFGPFDEKHENEHDAWITNSDHATRHQSFETDGFDSNAGFGDAFTPSIAGGDTGGSWTPTDKFDDSDDFGGFQSTESTNRIPVMEGDDDGFGTFTSGDTTDFNHEFETGDFDFGEYHSNQDTGANSSDEER